MVIPKKVVMARTIVKVYLRGKDGDLDSFITPINLSEKTPVITTLVSGGIWV